MNENNWQRFQPVVFQIGSILNAGIGTEPSEAEVSAVQ